MTPPSVPAGRSDRVGVAESRLRWLPDFSWKLAGKKGEEFLNFFVFSSFSFRWLSPYLVLEFFWHQHKKKKNKTKGLSDSSLPSPTPNFLPGKFSGIPEFWGGRGERNSSPILHLVSRVRGCSFSLLLFQPGKQHIPIFPKFRRFRREREKEVKFPIPVEYGLDFYFFFAFWDRLPPKTWLRSGNCYGSFPLFFFSLDSGWNRLRNRW